ncbi:unnamed protein product, partial [marine sediment metagenome]
PNPINVGKKGVTSVAICGTENFDVTTINATTVTFNDTGVSPLRWSYEDAATPFEFEPGVYDGTEETSDGYVDLVLKFDTVELVAALGLDGYVGEEVVLKLTGKLLGGTPFEGYDWVRVQAPKGKN